MFPLCDSCKKLEHPILWIFRLALHQLSIRLLVFLLLNWCMVNKQECQCIIFLPIYKFVNEEGSEEVDQLEDRLVALVELEEDRRATCEHNMRQQ